MSDPVAYEDAHQARRGPVERPGVRWRRAVHPNGGSRVAVGGDRVQLTRVADPVDEQRKRELVARVAADDQRVAHALGLVEGTRAKEVVRLGGAPGVVDELGDPVVAGDQRSLCQPVNSSGKSPHTSLSTVSSSRRIARLITPSR